MWAGTESRRSAFTSFHQKAKAMSVAYRAAWLFPVAEPAIADGILEVDDAGCITALRSGRDANAIDLGDAAIIPGLINPHCHLEFSDLATPIAPPRPFAEWLRRVVAHRRNRSADDATVIAYGLQEVVRTGTIAVGDILTADLTAQPYGSAEVVRAGPQLVAFRELIGPTPQAWPTLLAMAARHLETGRAAGLVPGLAPHAPYTVPQTLLEGAVALAAKHAAPVAVHLAETAAERHLLMSGTGELVELMQSLGLWLSELHPAGRTPLDWLRLLATLPTAAVVHGNYLNAAEQAFLAEHPHLTLVYCPRTHAYFDHPPHPWRAVLEAGGTVALGTDGRSSNPDLDVWAEAMFLRRRHPDLPTMQLLELVTRNAAAAIGLTDRCGVLSVGRPADFAVVRLPAAAQHSRRSPPELFAAGNDICRSFRCGIDVRPAAAEGFA